MLSANILIALLLTAAGTSALWIGGAPAPQAAAVAKRQTNREHILARAARGPAKRQTSAMPYPTCPFNTFDSSDLYAETNAYFSKATFVSEVAAYRTFTSVNEATCAQRLDGYSQARVAAYDDSDCYLYKSFDSISYDAEVDTIVKDSDCATAIATYGLPSGTTCCQIYASSD